MHLPSGFVLLLSLAQPAVDAPRELRAYELRFLTDQIAHRPLPDPHVRDLSLLETEERRRYGLSRDSAREAPPGVALVPEEIVDLIRRSIAPDTWADEQNSILAVDGELRVVQTPEVHEEIEDLLLHLAARRARGFEIEVRLVDGALAEGLAGVSRSAPPPTPEAVAALLEQGGENAHRVVLTSYNHQTVSATSGHLRASVADTDVNQTGVVPVVNPVVAILPLGVALEARASSVASTGDVRVALRAMRLARSGEVSVQRTAFGDLESVPLQEQSLRTVLVVEPGTWALAGSFRAGAESDGTGEFAVVLRVTRSGPGAPPGSFPEAAAPRPGGFVPRLYDVGFLFEGGRGNAVSPAHLLPLLTTNVEPPAWRDPRTELGFAGNDLHVTARADTHREVSASIEELARQQARPAVLRVAVLEGPAGSVLALQAAARDGLVLPEGWRNAAGTSRFLLDATAVGLAGEEMEARGFVSRTFVAGVESVSGGTAWSITEVPDLTVDSAGNGFTLRATVAAGLRDASRLWLDLDLRCSRTRFLRRAEFRARVRDGKSNPPAEVPAQHPYLIELPEEESLHCRTAVAVPRGEPVLLEVEPAGEGLVRFVVATVTVVEPAAGATSPTVPIRAQRERRMRIFDLGSLRYPTRLEHGLLPEAPGSRDGDGVSLHPHLWDLQDAERTGPWLGPQQVEQAIRRSIAPESWSDPSHELAVDAETGTLTVIQAPAVLEQVAEFLSRLEARTSRLVRVDLALVPPQVLDHTRPGWDDPGRPPWLDGEAFDDAINSAEGTAEWLSCVTPPGAWRRLSPASLARYLSRYDYVSTGVIPTVRPGVTPRLRGTHADVLVLPSTHGRWCRLDLRFGEAGTDTPPHVRKLRYGDLDLFRHADAQVGTTAVLRFGEVAVLGAVRLESDPSLASDPDPRGPSARSFVALVRVLRIDAEVAADPAPGLPAALDASLLIEPRRRFELGRLGLHADPLGDPFGGGATFVLDSGEGHLPSLLSRDSLEIRLAQSLAGENGPGPRLELLSGTVFVNPASSAAPVARRLEELARRTARVLRIHVFQASVSGEEWVRSGAGRERLDRAQVRSLSEHTEFRACLVGLPGWDLTLGSVAGRRYVADLDHVSGGTAERMIEVGLPVVGSAVSGLLLTARADLVPGARWVELRVQGENGSPAIFEREGRARSAQALEPHDGLPSGVGDDGATSRDGWLTIDLPEQDTRRWEHVVTAELGKPVLLGASPDATRPGRTVILVATVELFPFLAGQ